MGQVMPLSSMKPKQFGPRNSRASVQWIDSQGFASRRAWPKSYAAYGHLLPDQRAVTVGGMVNMLTAPWQRPERLGKRPRYNQR
jgi:hypothetical protein